MTSRYWLIWLLTRFVEGGILVSGAWLAGAWLLSVPVSSFAVKLWMGLLAFGVSLDVHRRLLNRELPVLFEGLGTAGLGVVTVALWALLAGGV